MSNSKSNFNAALEQLLSKEITEAIFKNISWLIICGTILKLSLVFFHEGSTFYGLILVTLLFPLLLLNLMYGVNHIIKAIDDKLGAGISQLITINSSDTNTARVYIRTISLLLGTKRGLLYLVFSICYLEIGIMLPELIAHSFSNISL